MIEKKRVSRVVILLEEDRWQQALKIAIALDGSVDKVISNLIKIDYESMIKNGLIKE